MKSPAQTKGETSSERPCALPRWRYLNSVLTACREAVQADRPEYAAEVEELLPFPTQEERYQVDRDRAIGAAERMGLIEGEATELADALRELGAEPENASLRDQLREADFDEETRFQIELLLRRQPPSAEETVHALRASYSSAHSRWKGYPGERGWALHSTLIPELINPVLSLDTAVAKFAAAKLAVELTRTFGRSVDGYHAARWIRILDPTMIGAAASLRALAVELENASPGRPDGIILEDADESIAIEKQVGNSVPRNR